ncbi:MAG: protein kinase [Deltaproteobacteria bacterium]|nr:protein kinase [Deltaproteobacteria bacterium]
MKEKPEKLNLIFVALIVLIFIAFSHLQFSVFELIERNIYDMETGLFNPATNSPPQIALIEIDDKSLSLMGKWPWPRSSLARIINILDKNGVRLIGLDIPLQTEEPDTVLNEIKTLKQKIDTYAQTEKDIGLKDWMLENLNQILEKYDNDLLLVNSVKKTGKVILPAIARIDSDNKSGDQEELSFSKCFITSSNIPTGLLEKISVSEIISPFPELARNVLGFGHDILAVDDIMDIRLHPLFINLRGALFPSFPLRLAIAHLNQDPKQVIASENHLLLGGKAIPLVNGKMLMKFTKSKEEFLRFSFADLLNSGNEVLSLKGKTALISFNHSGSDSFDTPVSKNMPKSELIARTVSAIINNRAISRPFWIAVLETLFLILTGFFTAVTFPRKTLPRRLVWTAGMIIIIFLVSFLLISMTDIWFKPTYIAFCLIMIILFFTVADIFFPDKYQEEVYERILEKGKRLLDGPDDPSVRTDDVEAKDSRVGNTADKIRSKVGRYEIISELGKGSMGLVYKAKDPKINRMVAIKTIRLSDEFDDDVIHEIKERFFREAEIAGKLSHPSIVTIHDVGEDKDLTYIAMEYIDGKDLEQFTKKGNLLSFKKVLDVTTKIAEALDFAHKADVIHRDIKPANVMILANGQVKVTDFGIAKAISSSRTKTGVILGTPNYMSPEQIMGQKVDARSDIFSLGILFFQLLTGELPFHGENLSGLLYQITQVKHPSPRNYNSKIPKVCEQIIDKALAKDPKKRFKTARDVARVIKLLVSRIDQMRETRSKAGR